VTYPYSTPTNPGSTGHGLSWKLVRVVRLIPERLGAVVVDQFGKGMEVRYDLMPAKGMLPAANENWIVEHKYGRWVLAAICTGGDIGVTTDDVGGLSDAFDEVAVTTTALDARLDKNEAPGKHLWGNGSVITMNENTSLAITSGIVPVRTAGIATATGGQFKFNRAGRWALNVRVTGNATVFGGGTTVVQFGTPNPATDDGGAIAATCYTYTSLAAMQVVWTGWVDAAQAAQAFTVTVNWSSTDVGTLSVGWRVGLEYLGPF
jgi:hypothetical protein